MKTKLSFDEFNRFMSIDVVEQGKYELRVDRVLCQISPLALAWIDIFLNELTHRSPRKLKVLEFGSGVSTLWLGQTFPEAEVFSVEANKGWFEKVTSWVKERKLENVTVVYEKENRNYYLPIGNPNYFRVCEKFGPPFDLIINDGAVRELVGDSVLGKADEFLTNGGLYLRHDYEKSFDGVWVAPHPKPLEKWIYDKGRLCYDAFCAAHPGYSLVTVNGNGKWGYKAEFGGVWRRLKS